MTTSDQLQKEIEQLRLENQIIKEIATPSGFFNFYFKQLKEERFESNTACFNHVNELYNSFFGEYKYSDYNSFRNIKNKMLKK